MNYCCYTQQKQPTHRASWVDHGGGQTAPQYSSAISAAATSRYLSRPVCHLRGLWCPTQGESPRKPLVCTLFGTYKLYSPRLEHCDCTRRKTSSFRPLSALLTESVAPELLYMEAKWSSLVSYGMSLDALQDFLPLDLTLDVKTVRYDTLKVAKRMEAELGEERSGWHCQVVDHPSQPVT